MEAREDKQVLAVEPPTVQRAAGAVGADGPRYPTGPLPVEYLPLNAETVHNGDRFGPLMFRIGSSSHDKHLAYLNATEQGDGVLTPFEMWPFPRVVSQWKFGRINEVISVEAKRVLHGGAAVGEELSGETVVDRIARQRGICFGRFASETRGAGGRLVMESEDTILLANGCDAAALREAVRKTTISDAGARYVPAGDSLDSWSLSMRFQWPEDLWHNNVHTRGYASALGFAHPLVEGPAVVDRVWWHVRRRRLNWMASPTLVRWRYRGPLYEGTPVVLVRAGETSGRLDFVICGRDVDSSKGWRVLMEIEISKI